MRDSVSRSHTQTNMNKKNLRTMDHNNILKNTMDCHPHVEWKKSVPKKKHALKSNEKKNWFEILTEKKKFSQSTNCTQNQKGVKSERESGIVRYEDSGWKLDYVNYFLSSFFPDSYSTCKWKSERVKETYVKNAKYA